MYDRPTLEEMIDAVRMHLETEVIPAVRDNPKLYFRTLVATNLLKIAGREFTQSDEMKRREWLMLNAVEGKDMPLPESDQALHEGLVARNIELCEAIRDGHYDENGEGARYTLFEHLKGISVAQLQVANPKYLMKLQAEENDPDLDAWANR